MRYGPVQPRPVQPTNSRLEYGRNLYGFNPEANTPKQVSEVEVAPIDYREGDELTTTRKLPGIKKYGNINQKWGVTDSTDLSDYRSLRVR